ncbi:10250_t:CDS:2, partial [Racocetra fulgida]
TLRATKCSLPDQIAIAREQVQQKHDEITSIHQTDNGVKRQKKMKEKIIYTFIQMVGIARCIEDLTVREF